MNARPFSGIVFSIVFTACAQTPSTMPATNLPETLIALEKTALDRWGRGDPHGYLWLYDVDVTYFDPTRETRADGLAAMQAYYAPITGKIKVDRYEMIAPKVQSRGDVAIMTYQLISHVTSASGKPFVVRWNATKVYGRSGSEWKILHDHWSYIQPELKEPSPE